MIAYWSRGPSWGAILFTLTLGLVPVVAAWALFLRPAPAVEPAAAPPPAPTAAPSVPPPKAEELHSKWVSQTPPKVIFVGATTTVTLTYRNTGSVAWVKGSASEARLGIPGEDERWAGMGVDWVGPTRPAAQHEDRVEPGQLASFRFTLRGTLPGDHAIPLRPVVDGVAWLEDEGAHVPLRVIEGAN